MLEKALASLLAIGLSGAALFGCSDEPPVATDGDDTGTTPARLAFEPGTTLMMSPMEQRAVAVRVTPAEHQVVNFGIITDDVAALDASLDPLSDISDGQGLGNTLLRASSLAGTFAVRAWLDDEIEARLGVSVSAEGYGTLRIFPEYKGSRELEPWVASVRTGTACSELADPLSDGPLRKEGSSPLSIEAVPVGPAITVTVHAGELAAGCLSIPRLAPDEQRDVQIVVTDLPLDTSSGGLTLGFGVDYASPAFEATLDAAQQRALEAFTSGQAEDAAALLAAWRESLDPSLRAAFDSNATAYDFEAKIADLLGSPTLLRDRMTLFLDDATTSVVSADTWQGELGFGAESATFTLTSAGGVPAATSGFELVSSWSASLDPGDVLLLGGTLEYAAAGWLCAIADVQTLASDDASPAALLAEEANCAAIGNALLSASSGTIYPGCTTPACAQAGCEAALVQAVAAASQADTAKSSQLAVAMSGQATAGSGSAIASYEGSWLGTVNPGEAPLSGPVSGTALEP